MKNGYRKRDNTSSDHSIIAILNKNLKNQNNNKWYLHIAFFQFVSVRPTKYIKRNILLMLKEPIGIAKFLVCPGR